MIRRSSLVLLAVLFAVGAKAQDPVLMKINKKPVYKSDFEYLYHKNNAEGAIDQKTLTEYVDLFVNFKLKVEEAKTQGLDTVPTFVREYKNYKNQLAHPYLDDAASTNTVAQEIYKRLGENIEVSHILVRFSSEKMLPADTLEAYNKAKMIRERLVGTKKKKAENFEAVALETSEDPGVKMGEKPGYLGWVSSMVFVAPFEDAMYGLKTGELSQPVRSRFGYHLIKVHDRKPNPGEVNAAHIMFSFPIPEKMNGKPTQAESDSVRAIADGVYKRLQAGESFGELCKEFSSDKPSVAKEGNIGWFGFTSRLPQSFKDAAFALKNTNDYSAPFITPFGFHIVRLLDKKQPETYTESEARIKEQLKSSDQYSKVLTLEDVNLKKVLDYKLDQATYNKLLQLSTQYFPLDSVFIEKTKNDNASLFTIEGKSFSVSDFSSYLQMSQGAPSVLSTEVLASSVENFVRMNLKDIQYKELDQKYPEYARLAQEYHDGILLFDVMNKEVWDKASTDTLGLEKQFKANKAKYVWDAPKYKGMVVHAKDQQSLDKVAKFAKKYKDTDKLLEALKIEAKKDSTIQIRVERGVWAKGENSFADKLVYKTGGEVKENASYPLHTIYGKMIKAPETFFDIKGLVVADYQDALEKEWMQALKAKYPVEIDEEILKTVK